MNSIQYSTFLTDSELSVLQELRRETNLKALMPRMLSGHHQGVLLQFISKMLSPKHILEIGTYTGYSTICLAQGLSDDGKITTIDKNDEIDFISQKYFKKSNLTKKINQIFGDAKKIIPTLNILFDLVFIDADKRDYLEYYKSAFNKLKNGGYIIADNVFWNGKVYSTDEKKDDYTKGIIEFNNFVKNDVRVEKITLPIRDGLLLIRKK